MNVSDLPPMDRRVTRSARDASDLPEDPVGIAAAQFLVELLDGLVVELEYFPGDEVVFDGVNSLTQASTGSRLGPEPLETVMTVNMASKVAPLYNQTGLTARLPDEIRDLPRLALQAADRIGLDSGVDGRPLPPGITQALQDAIVVDVVAETLHSTEPTEPAIRTGRTVEQVLSHMIGLSTTRVEGRPVSHGVVIDPSIDVDDARDEYPADFLLKRVPLIFDGRNSVLRLDAAGGAVEEIARQGLARRATERSMLADFESQVGEAGALVAFLSSSYAGVGIYLHEDGTIWVFVNGSPLIVRRGPRWRALPLGSLMAGMEILAGRSEAGALITRTAVLLSLSGHGGILAVAESSDVLDEMVPRKDRPDLDPLADSKEGPIHRVLDSDELDVPTLVRLARIDGATIISPESELLAYAAVVSSEASEGEGARTAAARHLSSRATIVLKVSEDGPITVFQHGESIGTLLA
jgi:hypothetical protein